MELHAAAAEIERLEKADPTPNGLADEIRILLEKHADLMIYRSGKDFVYCSASVNHYAERYDQTENINAPPGERLVYVWPYTMSEGRKVYSNPPYFIVGRDNERGFGIEPQSDWNDQLDNAQISTAISRKVRSFLKSKPPISYT